jgi:hypothetical protein
VISLLIYAWEISAQRKAVLTTMGGKAIFFKYFASGDVFPICLAIYKGSNFNCYCFLGITVALRQPYIIKVKHKE